MTTQRIRKAPYGFPRSPIGAGAILQRAEVGNVGGAFPAIPLVATEVSSDMASQDMRASLTGVAEDSILRMVISGEVQADSSWAADGQLLLAPELSRNPAGGFITPPAISTNPTLPLNLRAPGVENIMRHSIYFEADVLASDIGVAADGDEFTLRWLATASANGLALETFAAGDRVFVRLLELAPDANAAALRGLRRPGAGPYRFPLSTGAIVQEDAIRRPASANGTLQNNPAELSSGALGGTDMRPALVPLDTSNTLRVDTQVIVGTNDDWIAAGRVDLSLQVSDDDGANWVELGLAQIVPQANIEATGAPDVANDMRHRMTYEASAPLSTAFPAYVPGTEVIARVVVESAGPSSAGFVTNDGGALAATFVKLLEVRA